MRKKRLIQCICNHFKMMVLSILIFFLPFIAYAEGTKELEPPHGPASQCCKLCLYTDVGEHRTLFAQNGCPEPYRLNVHIADHTKEVIYFGFGEVAHNQGTTAMYYRFKDPDGIDISGGFKLMPVDGEAGFINTHSQAYAGPNIGGGNPAGYSPLVITPQKNGDYYIEFASDLAGSHVPYSTVSRFDITVNSVNSGMKLGRLWSKAWQVTNNTTYANQPICMTKFYVYSDDGIVTSVDLNGLAGGVFSAYCNQWGVSNTGNWIQDRKSTPNWPAGGDLPQYKLFLNNPDINVYPTGTPGTICNVSTNSNCDGSIDYLIRVTQPGTITLNIDVPPAGAGGEDVVLTGEVTGSPDCSLVDTIKWNGLNGYNQPVSAGDNINTSVSYMHGLTNLPFWDMEANPWGIKVDIVRPLPTGSTILPVYWDDTSIYGGTANIDVGCVYPTSAYVTGCHSWSRPFGDNRMINTWWYYLTEGSYNLVVQVMSIPVTPAVAPIGEGTVCVGGIETYTIPPITSAEKYVWYKPDGTVDTTLTNSITLTFPTLGSGGTLQVRGYNESCGVGGLSPSLTITVVDDPVPIINGDNTACLNSVINYDATPANLTSYSWSVIGGTIMGASNTSTVSVKWTSAGQQTLTLVSTSHNCGARITEKIVTVNPLPNISITGTTPCCVNEQYVYTTEAGMQGYIWSLSDGGNIISGNGTYQATVQWTNAGTHNVLVNYTDANGCALEAPESMQVTVHQSPTAFAGNNAAICIDDTYTINDASTTHSTGVTWTTSGNGSFNNANILNPTYTPSAADIANGSVTLTITANGISPCGNATSSMVLTLNPLPTPTYSGNTSVCLNTTQTYTAPAGMSDYLWTLSSGGTIVGGNNIIGNNQQTVIINWNTVGDHTLSVNYTDANGCRNPEPHTKTITVNTLTPPTITGPTSVCENSTGLIYTTEAGMMNYSWTSSGAAAITQSGTSNQATVTWLFPGSHYLGVVYVDLTGCSTGIPGTLYVDVHPLPTPTINGKAQACHLTENNYSTETGQTDYIWDVVGGTIVSGNGTHSVVVRWDNIGNNQISVNYTTEFGCTAPTPTTFVVEVLASPTPVVSGPTSVCSFSEGNIYSTATNFVDYTWSVAGANIIGTSTNSEIDLSWNTTGVKTIGVTVVDAHGCVGTSNPYDVTVNELPVPTLNGANTGCTGIGGNVYNTDAGMSNYNWTVTGGDITTGQGTGNVEVLWTESGQQTVSVVYMDSNGCTNNIPSGMEVIVSPYPEINAGEDAYMCSIQGSHYFADSYGQFYDPNSISWTFYGVGYTCDGTLDNPNILHPTYTPGPIDISSPNRTINFIIRVEGTANCSGQEITDTIQLQIDPYPLSNAGADGATCGFEPYQLSGSAKYQNAVHWTTSGSGTFSNANSLTPTYTAGVSDVGKTIELTLNTSGCRGLVNASSMWLTVNNYPYGEISCDTAICEGEQAIIRFNLRGTPPWNLTYTNGLVEHTLTNIMSSPHQISITPETSTSHWIKELSDAICTAPNDSLVGSTNIEVNVLPIQYNLEVSHNGTYCAGTPGVEITLSNSEVGVSYQLIYNTLPIGAPILGSGNPISFGIHSAQGQYNVEATTVIANCKIMMLGTVNVIMTPTPVTDFAYSETCQGDSIYFTLSGNYLNQISLYEWDFGDGNYFTSNSLVNPSHLYANSGTYTVTLHVVDIYDCEYSISHDVEVYPNPNSFFSHSSINCLGDSTYFHDLSTTTGSYITEWVWDFGDGTSTTVLFPNSADVAHLYNTADVYTVSLTITDARGCTSTYSKDIEIHNFPIADFTHSQGCQGQTIYFIDESQNAQGGNITQWLWNFGDPASGVNNTSTLQNPEHLYVNSGQYNVELIVYNLNGCSDTIVKTVSINEGATADFFYTNNCKNDTSFFYIDNAVTNVQAIANYHWNFGDGNVATGANTYNIYSESGTYVVILTVTDTNGCVTKVQKNVSVYESPVSNFSHTTDVCAENVVTFNDLSYSNQGYIETAEWDFGDGVILTLNHPNITTEVEHIYMQPGVYQVKLTVHSSLGCKSEKTSIINVHGINIEEVIYTAACQGHYTEFSYVYTVNAGNSVVGQSWNFGDPASGMSNYSTLANPKHIYNAPGIYTVTLTVNTSKGCSNTINYDIEVHTEPDVDFTFISSCTGNPTVFNSTSSASVIHWLWDFGDGTSSNIANPEHIYTVAETYYVTLTVTDTNGCSNVRSRTLTVNAGPQPMYTYNQP
ncbi:MAG: PKD domain-containing protein, partial [Bacteroidales bacterium]